MHDSAPFLVAHPGNDRFRKSDDVEQRGINALSPLLLGGVQEPRGGWTSGIGAQLVDFEWLVQFTPSPCTARAFGRASCDPSRVSSRPRYDFHRPLQERAECSAAPPLPSSPARSDPLLRSARWRAGRCEFFRAGPPPSLARSW